MLGPVVSENVVDGSKYPGSDNSVNNWFSPITLIIFDNGDDVVDYFDVK